MSYEFEATDDLEFGAATCAGCDEITSVDLNWFADVRRKVEAAKGH